MSRTIDRRQLARWLPTLTKFTSTQTVVQIAGVAAGILIVRFLSKQEYALYTLAATAIAAMAVLADSGLSSAFTSIGGRVRESPARLASVLRTAMTYRRRLAALLALVAAVPLFFLFRQNGAEDWLSIVLVALTLANFGVTLTNGLLQSALNLEYRFSVVQRVNLVGALMRVALTAALGVLPVSALLPVLVVNLVVAFSFRLAWIRLNRPLLAANVVTADAELPTVFRRNVRRILPNNVFFVFQGQIVYYALGAIGLTSSIANISAASRYAAVFAVLLSTINGVAVPAFARARDIRRVRAILLITMAGYVAMCAVITALAYLFRGILLGALGPAYRDLDVVLILSVAGAAAFSVASALGSMCQARGWLKYSWTYIPLTLAWTVLLFGILDLHELVQAAIFSATTFVPGLLMNFARLGAGLRSERGGERTDTPSARKASG